MEFVKALLELLFSILAIGVSVTLFLLSIENIIEDNDKEAVKYSNKFSFSCCVVLFIN